jgi:hypothetical protein
LTRRRAVTVLRSTLSFEFARQNLDRTGRSYPARTRKSSVPRMPSGCARDAGKASPRGLEFRARPTWIGRLPWHLRSRQECADGRNASPGTVCRTPSRPSASTCLCCGGSMPGFTFRLQRTCLGVDVPSRDLVGEQSSQPGKRAGMLNAEHDRRTVPVFRQVVLPRRQHSGSPTGPRERHPAFHLGHRPDRCAQAGLNEPGAMPDQKSFVAHPRGIINCGQPGRPPFYVTQCPPDNVGGRGNRRLGLHPAPPVVDPRPYLYHMVRGLPRATSGGGNSFPPSPPSVSSDATRVGSTSRTTMTKGRCAITCSPGRPTDEARGAISNGIGCGGDAWWRWPGRSAGHRSAEPVLPAAR